MGYNKENYRRIREEYATKHLIAEKAAEERRLAVHAALPEVAAIDRKLARTGLDLMGASLAEPSVREARIAELREENRKLNDVRNRLLAAAGYPADYTDVKYDCPKCSDSGYVGIKMCECMKKALTLAGFASSGLGSLVEKQTFDNFSLEYYRDNAKAYEEMSKFLEAARKYAEEFAPDRTRNLLLMGGTGLGKTHMSSAIARRIIERGFDVCYTSAISMINDFDTEQFSNARIPRGELTDKYFDCDLLIIDDLGTELVNQFTTSVLYNLLNVRINYHRPIIISTNLSPKDLMTKYNDRITSRLFGEFRPVPFLGSDIRMKKVKNS